MKKFEAKRQWYSRLLLCIFVPMLLLASVHVHQQTAGSSVECYACLHHIHHDGHFSSRTFSIDNCLLCHFLTTPYVAAAVIAFFAAAIVIARASWRINSGIIAVSHDAVRLRAPPVRLF